MQMCALHAHHVRITAPVAINSVVASVKLGGRAICATNVLMASQGLIVTAVRGQGWASYVISVQLDTPVIATNVLMDLYTTAIWMGYCAIAVNQGIMVHTVNRAPIAQFTTHWRRAKTMIGLKTTCMTPKFAPKSHRPALLNTTAVRLTARDSVQPVT